MDVSVSVIVSVIVDADTRIGRGYDRHPPIGIGMDVSVDGLP